MRASLEPAKGSKHSPSYCFYNRIHQDPEALVALTWHALWHARRGCKEGGCVRQINALGTHVGQQEPAWHCNRHQADETMVHRRIRLPPMGVSPSLMKSSRMSSSLPRVLRVPVYGFDAVRGGRGSTYASTKPALQVSPSACAMPDRHAWPCQSRR